MTLPRLNTMESYGYPYGNGALTIEQGGKVTSVFGYLGSIIGTGNATLTIENNGKVSVGSRLSFGSRGILTLKAAR